MSDSEMFYFSHMKVNFERAKNLVKKDMNFFIQVRSQKIEDERFNSLKTYRITCNHDKLCDCIFLQRAVLITTESEFGMFRVFQTRTDFVIFQRVPPKYLSPGPA